MRYEILGQLRLVDGERTMAVSARKMETVLAVLLARADQIVPTDRLIDEMWGERPPRQALSAVWVYVCHLRKMLARPGQDSPIVREPAGYALRVGADEIDVRDFQEFAGRGVAAARAGRHDDAVDLLDRALGLWRGQPFSGLLDAPILAAYATAQEQTRLECLDALFDSHLARGSHRQVITPLYTLVSEYPLHESLYRYLMIALHRCERRADALRVYQSAWDTLDRELGVEPCRSLRLAHQAILASESPAVEFAA